MPIVVDSKVINEDENKRYDFVYSSLEGSFSLYPHGRLEKVVASYGESKDGVIPKNFDIDVTIHTFNVYNESCFEPIFKLAEEYENRFGVHAVVNKDYQ